jgi:hypothetical protein
MPPRATVIAIGLIYQLYVDIATTDAKADQIASDLYTDIGIPKSAVAEGTSGKGFTVRSGTVVNPRTKGSYPVVWELE